MKRFRLLYGVVIVAAAVTVVATGFIGSPAPFADPPVDVPLKLGDRTVTVEGGNESCNFLSQRVGWR